MLKKTIYGVFILILCLCASGYGQGGNTKGDEATYKEGLNKLVTQSRKLSNDSLLLIVKDFNNFHTIYQDEASLVYASLSQANYEHLKANHVGAMRYAIDALNRAHKYNIKENVWTVNSPNLMLQLINKGVDGLITDRPDLALRVLAEKYPNL